MSWLTQQTGIINHYHPALKNWFQPIRVVHPMLIHMWQNTNADFFSELQLQIQQGKISKELNLRAGEVAISIGGGRFLTPRVNNKTREIELHESFLSYLWCITYSVLVLYSEMVDYPSINAEVGYEKYAVSEEAKQQAREIFDYARMLIAMYEPWDKKNLPNPKMYLAEKRTYVESTNLFYTEAVKFILCHEFTHLKLHVDKIDADTPDSSFLDFEFEADNSAIDMMVAGKMQGESELAFARNMAIDIGIIYGILAMFFFRATTTGERHPNVEDRLTNALERIKVGQNHYAYGFACVGLQLWDEQFGHNFNWEASALISKREQYFRIIEQIKERQ